MGAKSGFNVHEVFQELASMMLIRTVTVVLTLQSIALSVAETSLTVSLTDLGGTEITQCIPVDDASVQRLVAQIQQQHCFTQVKILSIDGNVLLPTDVLYHPGATYFSSGCFIQ